MFHGSSAGRLCRNHVSNTDNSAPASSHDATEPEKQLCSVSFRPGISVVHLGHTATHFYTSEYHNQWHATALTKVKNVGFYLSKITYP